MPALDVCYVHKCGCAQPLTFECHDRGEAAVRLLWRTSTSVTTIKSHHVCVACADLPPTTPATMNGVVGQPAFEKEKRVCVVYPAGTLAREAHKGVPLPVISKSSYDINNLQDTTKPRPTVTASNFKNKEQVRSEKSPIPDTVGQVGHNSVVVKEPLQSAAHSAFGIRLCHNHPGSTVVINTTRYSIVLWRSKRWMC